MIGHSVGEYVAACLAGVMTLEDALWLVAERGRMMQQLPTGRMLALSATEEETRRLVAQHGELSVAAVNGPRLCVVSGSDEAVRGLEARCEAQGVDSRQLRTSHAFHSEMMEAIFDEFAASVRKIELKPPQIPFVSNVTGTWITAAEATEPRYWAEHLRRTVRFADGISGLSEKPERVMLEVGPGQTLCSAIRQTRRESGWLVLHSLPHALDEHSEVALLLGTLGRIWAAGTKIDWPGLYAHERRRRVVLPTYPFERQPYWVRLNRQAFGLDERRPAAPEHYKLTPEESVEALRRVLSRALPQALALTRDTQLAGGEIEAAVCAGFLEELKGTSRATGERSAPDAADGYAAPSGQIEQTIAAIWQELFGIERVGVHDNFFELGGNSLVGIQLMSRMRKVFMLEIPMNTLFESPTVAGLAGVVSEIHLKEQELQEVEQLLAEIEGLSAEELELRLNRQD